MPKTSTTIDRPFGWVTRDDDGGSTRSLYNLHVKRPRPKRDDGLWYGCDGSLLPCEFARLSSIRLKPGEGPVKARLVLAT